MHGVSDCAPCGGPTRLLIKSTACSQIQRNHRKREILMAKPEAPEAAPVKVKTDIHPYERKEKAGRYDQDVKDLIEAGEGAAITLTVPTDQVKKHMTYFQESAKQNERTARKTD